MNSKLVQVNRSTAINFSWEKKNGKPIQENMNFRTFRNKVISNLCAKIVQ